MKLGKMVAILLVGIAASMLAGCESSSGSFRIGDRIEQARDQMELAGYRETQLARVPEEGVEHTIYEIDSDDYLVISWNPAERTVVRIEELHITDGPKSKRTEHSQGVREYRPGE